MSKRKDHESDVQTEKTTPPESVTTVDADTDQVLVNYGIPVTVLDRLNVERSDLAERIELLDRFINGEKFGAVDQEERDRMKGQRTAMGHYFEILTARIAYHEKQTQATSEKLK